MQRWTTIGFMMCSLTLAGCEETSRVGSGCVDGVCPQALSRDDDACKITSDAAEIGVAEGVPATICLPTALRRYDDGTVQARVLYYLPSNGDPPIKCTDKPYLKPVGGELGAQHRQSNPESELCELNQLAVIDADGGEPIVAAGEGFYYDDFSTVLGTECAAGSAARVVVTPGARPSDATRIIFAANEAVAADGSVDPDLSCNPLRGSAPLGTPCLPAQTTYYDSQVVLETRSEACGDGVCLAYHLEGDTDPSCDTSESSNACASEEDIENRAYCTCRCDAPVDSPDRCACSDGFTCVDLVELRDDVAGSYCVKNAPVGRTSVDL
jgi:hypothetical protein